MKKKYTYKDHTFAICAYKESKYLEECIASLLEQTVKTNVIMITSTPNKFIEDIAGKYQIPLTINTGKSGIAEDWNFALDTATTPLVTITHQDDVYCKNYAEKIVEAANFAKDPIIVFSDYGELRDGKWVVDNRLLKVKQWMQIPLKPRWTWHSKWIRRRILSFGSPICCPSVTYCLDQIRMTIFTRQFRSDVDWQAWEKLSRLSGSFCYLSEVLMYHRIHEESETTAIIADNDRTKEDFIMFQKFWPRPIAAILEHFYGKSEKSNKL